MRPVLVLLTCAAVLSFPAPAPASTVGVTGEWHVAIQSESSRATAWEVGDVDSDGLHDVGTVVDDSAWVSFAPRDLPADTVAGQGGWRGFRIVGVRSDARMTGLDDVNGDGLREVMVGGSEMDSGGLAILFGRTDGTTIDLGRLVDDGFRVDGASVANGFGDAGDQNGDGRADIAYAVRDGIEVAFTPPDPAGATLLAGNPEIEGFRLVTEGLGPQYAGSLGDLDGDGRADLAAAYGYGNGSDPATVVGFASPGPGTRLVQDDAVGSGRAFVLAAPGLGLDRALAIRDRNWDDRRDLAVSGWSGTDSSVVIAYSPAFGTRRSVRPAVPGESETTDADGRQMVDVGDVDGDQRSDLGLGREINLSGQDLLPGRIPYATGPITCRPTGIGGTTICEPSGLDTAIGGGLPDRNGDGLAEVIAANYSLREGESDGRVHLNVVLSAPAPVIEWIGDPIRGMDEGYASFAVPVTVRTGDIRSLRGYTPSVSLAAGRPGSGAGFTGGSVPADPENGVLRTTASQRWFNPVPWGAPLEYQVAVATGRGAVALGPVRRSFFPLDPFATTPEADAQFWAKLWNYLNGTRRADRLVGTTRRDVLDGRRGDDVLVGRPGDDRLLGGRGRDRLRGGPGADRLDCGPGRDVAIVDRRDRVRRCERVRRV